jgi:hypothetical protein
MILLFSHIPLMILQLMIKNILVEDLSDNRTFQKCAHLLTRKLKYGRSLGRLELLWDFNKIDSFFIR